MPPETTPMRDPLLFGHRAEPGLVAVEVAEGRRGDEAVLFFREDDGRRERREPFTPFIIAELEAIGDCPVEYRPQKLAGRGRLNVCAWFGRWKDAVRAKAWLQRTTGVSPAAAAAPYLFLNDPVHQHLLASGRALFLGMPFEALRRLQVDIECLTAEGYEFCNPEREEDRIIAIGLSDQSGWEEVLSGAELSEPELLERFVARVRERDPDVIEGYNLFNFDLPYLAERARRHGIALRLGRDGSVPARRPSRFSVGERTLAYERFEVHGRHVVDVLFLVHAYDVAHRSLEGFGLKEAARHFGVAAGGRTHIAGREIAAAFRRDPGRVARYVRDDVVETRALGALLSRSSFAQAQTLPYSYQSACVRGPAAKIDALMLRAYLRRGQALPLPDAPREFAGGYTDLFVRGVIRNVHHCDVRSLYPSLMLAHRLEPRSDELGVFLELLKALRDMRLQAKADMLAGEAGPERLRLDALQSAFKVLINSFYGYLGFAQARFSDFDAAERVTELGRDLLRSMIAWLRRHGATPIEIDTDGIYFVPPPAAARDAGALEAFRRAFAASLPAGIEIEFDAEYRAMYSYKMKNYAVLTDAGEIVLKGAALKSRGLEPFQRAFLRDLVRRRLEGRTAEMAGLKAEYEAGLREGLWPIERLAKTERLRDAPATYAARVAAGKAPRNALYELAARAGRPYRAGDQLSYYVTGSKKNVTVHACARLVSEWDPGRRDENVAYYLAKLEALYRKFGAEEQPELGLGSEADREGGEGDEHED